jgi:predicted glycosyl hydrolase (DUF1957 family)
MRWYLEDLKVYNELNTIRIKYEELLSKYCDQLLSSNFKLEELEIKRAKLESENSQIQDILEQLEQKLQSMSENDTPIIKEINEDFDEKYSL